MRPDENRQPWIRSAGAVVAAGEELGLGPPALRSRQRERHASLTIQLQA
jgi:hypothetical protein